MHNLISDVPVPIDLLVWTNFCGIKSVFSSNVISTIYKMLVSVTSRIDHYRRTYVTQ